MLAKSSEFINYPYGNRFKYAVLDGLEIQRFQFAPDGQPGVVVQYQFSNKADRRRELRFQLRVKTDLLPVWQSEKLGITDAPDRVSWQPATRRFLARDQRHRWFAVWGATTVAGATEVPSPDPISTTGQGVTAASSYLVSIEPHDSAILTFVFAGSSRSSAEAEKAFSSIAANHPKLLERKKTHYAALIERARIRIPDQRLQHVYDWVRINNEWLVRDVPWIGRGLGAGLPEYPWWFGTDGAYSLHGQIASGDFDLAKQTLRLLLSQSNKVNGNGRIIHEVTTNGVVFNPGNTQETAHFIMTTAKVVRWSGDLAFAREMYPAMKRGIRWLLVDMDKDRNLFPGGYGVTEISGLNAELIDVAVYTQQALLATADVAGILGDTSSAARYRRQAEELKRRINDRLWLEDEGSYADFYGTRAQAISATEGVIKQIRLRGEDKMSARDRELIPYYERLRRRFEAMPDTTKGWITNRNWVVATPMETGIAPRERAIQALDRIRQNDVGEYGPYLSGVAQAAMMTISTGVLAVAEATYGRADQSLWYMNRIVETFGRKLPGSISEMMPDYGDFVQAWTVYGIVVPLVEHVFGVQPDAVQPDGDLRAAPAGWLGEFEHRGPAGGYQPDLVHSGEDRWRDRVPDRRQGERLAFRAEGGAAARCQVLPERQTDLPRFHRNQDDGSAEPATDCFAVAASPRADAPPDPAGTWVSHHSRARSWVHALAPSTSASRERQLSGGLRPMRGVLGQTGQHQVLERGGNRPVGPGRWRHRRRLRVLQQQSHRRLGGEHELARSGASRPHSRWHRCRPARPPRPPIACSGAMNAGVPWTAFSRVCAALVSAASRTAPTIPKSSTFTKSYSSP